MLTASELLADLDHYYCTTQHYKHPFGLLYTDGVKALAMGGECYWLIDAIASYQPGKVIRANSRLLEFQRWMLTVNPDKSALLACYENNANTCIPAITQKIDWTNFVLPEIELYVENGVLLLPSEH
ncbi:DUF6876 family protein [Acaryochloris sp. CCMEE 5410]|uniref:DUF6876 family protein n=1 Tax=Acaryochloris sp. CCMEE 5410 TaxID=310037 RepID=UPI00024852C2|nr:DUF6876 family protein [Acaryochloris sp. CCMEE 5410]KAI9130207.1 hypothetical protein ON05_031785 [Acaryochloris sp. CCMEE 5410]